MISHKRIFHVVMAAGILFCAAHACLIAPAAAQPPNPVVVIETSVGDISVELFQDKAPKTVNNFLQYAKENFYRGTIFHRVIKGFMVQGGGFTGDMVRKQTRAPIPNEAANGLKNERGTIAMARTADINSATAQFFINTVNNAALDHRGESAEQFGYAVFGKVIAGMDIVEEIERLATSTKGSYQNVPIQPAVMKAVRIKG